LSAPLPESKNSRRGNHCSFVEAIHHKRFTFSVTKVLEDDGRVSGVARLALRAAYDRSVRLRYDGFDARESNSQEDS
jgi:hypothetical protein